MKTLNCVCLIMVLTLPGITAATTYTGTPQYSAGTGSNQATIVIDFDADVDFSFTYNWDGQATGWDALSAIDIAGSLNVDATDWGDFGMFVNDFTYPSTQKFDYGTGVNTSWAYYFSTDNDGWTIDSGGVSFRSLSDGDWDSWVWSNYDEFWTAPLRTPGAAPIPEPATMLLLAFGGIMLRRRR